MKYISTLIVVFFLGINHVEAKTKSTFQVEGKKIEATVENFKPAFEINEKTKSQNALIQTYLDYNHHLASGNIKEASKLTQNPEQTEKMQNAYLQRLGGIEQFKKQMKEVLNSGLVMTHVVEIENAKMLIGTHPKHGAFANFFECSKDKCLLNSDMNNESLKKLGLIFNDIREGKIKL